MRPTNREILPLAERLYRMLAEQDYEGIEEWIDGRDVSADDIAREMEWFGYTPVRPTKKQLSQLIDIVCPCGKDCVEVWFRILAKEDEDTDLVLVAEVTKHKGGSLSLYISRIGVP